MFKMKTILNTTSTPLSYISDINYLRPRIGIFHDSWHTRIWSMVPLPIICILQLNKNPAPPKKTLCKEFLKDV